MVKTYTSWNTEDDSELSEAPESEAEAEPEPPAPPPSRRRATEPVAAPPPPSPPAKANRTRASTQNATEKSKQKVGRGAGPLRRPPRASTYAVSSLYDQIKQGMIDLDPEYQRGVVWTDKKQSELINSIFDNYYVPPVVFTVTRMEDGSERRICIDGKQRLTSICQFMDGKIPYKDSNTLRKVHYKNPPGSRRKVLPEKLQITFKNKQITCVEYEDLKPEEEREIFQRVQLGVALSPADRLPAINGPYADLVRAMRQEIESTEGFSGYLDWGKARGKDFQALGQTIYLIVNGKTAEKLDPTPTRLETFLARPDPPQTTLDKLCNISLATVKIYCRIVGDERLGAPLRRDLSPYEFTAALYLVSQYCATLSDVQLSDAMSRMRKSYKQQFKTQKKEKAATATDIFKYLVGFVRKTMPTLVSDLRDTVPSWGPAISYQPPSRSPSVANKRGRKRERKEETDVEMSEPLAASAAKRKSRTSSPPLSKMDVDEDEADDESDDTTIVKKKKKAKTANSSAATRTSGTTVKRSRSTTAGVPAPPSTTAPVASSSKTVAPKQSQPNIKGKASAPAPSASVKGVSIPTFSAQASSSNDVQMQVAQPSRPLNASRAQADPPPASASAPPASSRKPLPTRIPGHQKTPLGGASMGEPTPPPPASAPSMGYASGSGSGAGRSPAIPPFVPRSSRPSGYASAPSASATPANSPPIPHHVPQMVRTPTTEGPPPLSAGPAEHSSMGQSGLPQPPLAKPRPPPQQARKQPTRWPPLGTSGAPPSKPKAAPPGNSAAGAGAPASGRPSQPQPQPQPQQTMTTAAKLKAMPQEMIPLGKRSAPDHQRSAPVKRRKTGDGMDELGMGPAPSQSNNGSATASTQRRATVQGDPAYAQQHHQQQPHSAAPGPSTLNRQSDNATSHGSTYGSNAQVPGYSDHRYTPPPPASAAPAPQLGSSVNTRVVDMGGYRSSASSEPNRSRASTPSASGSLFSPTSSPVAEAMMPGLQGLNIQPQPQHQPGRETNTRGSQWL